MFDAERLLGNLISGSLGRALGGRGGSLLGSGLFGSRANLGIGLLGVAMAAYQHYQQNAAAAPVQNTPSAGMPPPPPLHAVAAATPRASVMPPPPPPPDAQRNADAIMLMRAMIAAAQADGSIDADERARIVAAAHARTPEERAFLETELAAPQSIEQLAAASRAALAPEVYAAAAHAIVRDSERERAWLDRLAAVLALDPAARADIDRRFAGVPA